MNHPDSDDNSQCPACGSTRTVHVGDGMHRCMDCNYLFEADDGRLFAWAAEDRRENAQRAREKPR